MEYRSIPTTLGRAKLEQAALMGVPLQLTVVEFGDGGGAEYAPTGLETALRGKVYEAAPNMIFKAEEAETWVELQAVIPFDVGGWWLREYGVRDAAGDLIFIGNLPQSFKPQGSSGAIKDVAFELLFDIQNADSVTLKVDPAKVLATRKYVDDKIAAQDLTSLSPPGLVSAFARSTAPAGWLKANGAAVSRVVYSRLFAAIGTAFGVGDGATTFNLPDLRGEFVRGLDDARGIDPARTLGTVQLGQNAAHTHTATTGADGGHSHTASTNSSGAHTHSITANGGTGADSSNPYGSYRGSGSTGTDSASINSAGSHSHTVSVSTAPNHTHTVSVDSSGGAEARPRNVALLYCIKY